ncbi:FecR family protein [Thalassospiraceae bacterium LMO-SO8]|nr:FecR family protein [Alphaproteobacteria bacterium LMO-S08]WND74342.1 FecR family protein [Thalassospiraceae bacterium LMO-SO8]
MINFLSRPAPLLRVITVFLMAVFAAIRPAAANDGAAWLLAESSGNVHITTSGVRPVALTTGDLIGPGQRIVTDTDGRAVLRRGKNTIVVSPNSILEVPSDAAGGLMTRIRHVLGTLLFDVEKRKEQHFEVLTPDVAVVVKGTTFTTSVGPQGAVVHVISGLVQVADIRSGQSVFVRPGQTAVSPTGGGRVDIQGGPSSGPKPNAPKADGDIDANATETGKANKGGVKIAHNISGQNRSLGAVSGGLLRKDGNPGKGHGKGTGEPAGLDAAGFEAGTNGNGLALGQLPGFTPPGLTNVSGTGGNGLALGQQPGFTPPGLIDNPNANGGNPNAHGGNPNANGGNGKK